MGRRTESALLAACRATPALRGKTNIGWKLMDRASARNHLDGTFALTLDGELRVELPRRSRMAWECAAHGRYDEEFVAELMPYIRPGTIVLDVGASLGLWAVQLGSIARQMGAVVHAFEPNPDNLPWLKRNLDLNGLADYVTVHEIGLGDRAAELSFGMSEGGIGNGAILDPSHPRVERSVQVQRLDDLVFDQPISVIKMDVEGFEPAVLRGAKQTVAATRPVIYGEFAPGWLAMRNETLESLTLTGYRMTMLKSERSRPWRSLDSLRSVPVDRSSPSSAENLLLLPR